MGSVVRAALFRGLPQLVDRLGGDGAALLAHFRVPADALDSDAMHPRTLQRRLAAESTTFDAVLDEVRRDAAERLITETDVPFAQVTALVGLTEQSALSRAARRWFGRSPRELRRERRRLSS